MRIRRLRPQFPVAARNESTRLFKFDADDLFARRLRLRVDSSLGQTARSRRRRRGLGRPR